MPVAATRQLTSEERPSLWALARYFLWLGTFGFGGPIALAAHMRRDLVDERKWLSEAAYLEGLALAQLAPGPLAAQLAMYLGYVLHGIVGATVVAFVFIAPSFAMVLALAVAYVRYSGLAWIHAVFYGVGAAAIGIMTRSAVKLVKGTLKRDGLLWAVFAAMAVSTAVTQREIIWLFLGSGIFVMIVRGRLPAGRVRGQALIIPAVALASYSGRPWWPIFAYFVKSGLFVFGSGLAIVPFLHGGVVVQHHWLSERQFVDAVAVAMITPGPVVITVAFIGFLIDGVAGATAASLGVFLPVYLVVVCFAPFYRRTARHPQLKAFVQGVTAAATGAISGAVVVLASRALLDVTTWAIAIGTILVLLTTKVPEPVLVLAAAAVGLIVSALH